VKRFARRICLRPQWHARRFRAALFVPSPLLCRRSYHPEAASRICLRPHHGLCMAHFIGRGYSPAFVQNMKKIMEALEQHPHQPILLQSAVDDICRPCPNNIGGQCKTHEKALLFDMRCLERLGLREGQTCTWQTLREGIEALLHPTSASDVADEHPLRYQRLPGAPRDDDFPSQHTLAALCGECDWFSLCQEIGDAT